MVHPLRLSELEDPALTIMLYGGPGVGKTVFACSSQHLRTVLLDVDQGASSARYNVSGFPETGTPPTRVDTVTVINCPTFTDILHAYGWLVANRQYVDLVVLDSATELQRCIISELTKQARSGEPVASKREWGICLNMMDDLIRSFKRLHCHTIWTAHEVSSQDDGMPAVFRPAFQGQFRDYYARHFSEIWRYVMRHTEEKDAAGRRQAKVWRALCCQPTPFSHGKSRSNALAVWEQPHLDALLSKIAQRLTAGGAGTEIST
jgi:hypothetical protein